MRDIFWICLRRAHRHPWSINVHRRPPGLSQRSNISSIKSDASGKSWANDAAYAAVPAWCSKYAGCDARSDVKLGTCKHCCNILYSRTNFITTAFATKRPRFQDYQIPGMRSCNRNENRRKASRYVKICTTGILPMTGPLKSLEYVWTKKNHVNICMKSPRKSTTNL